MLAKHGADTEVGQPSRLLSVLGGGGGGGNQAVIEGHVHVQASSDRVQEDSVRGMCISR